MTTRRATIALLAALVFVSTTWLWRAQAQTPAQGAVQSIVQPGKTYRVLLAGMGTVSFTVLEIGKGGLVKVQASGNGHPGAGIDGGTVWWLNLNQAILVQAQ